MRAALLALAALVIGASAAMAQDWPVVPNPSLTPGEVRTDLTLAQMCATKWGKDARAVTEKMKDQVFEAYGIPEAARHLPDGKPAFEIDHLASRELLGKDTVANLWPQPYTGPWNAHLKDRTENRLHVEVCAGRLDLAAAQRMIIADWRVPYRKYFGEPPP